MFAMMITIVIGYAVMGDVFNQLNDSDNFEEADLVNMNDSYNRYVPIFDMIPLMILIFLFLATIISSFWINTHPAYFFVSVFLLIIFTVIFYIFSQVWFDLTLNSTMLNDSASNFTAIDFMMSNFVVFGVLIGFVVLAVLYAKFGGFQS